MKVAGYAAPPESPDAPPGGGVKPGGGLAGPPGGGVGGVGGVGGAAGGGGKLLTAADRIAFAPAQAGRVCRSHGDVTSDRDEVDAHLPIDERAIHRERVDCEQLCRLATARATEATDGRRP